MKSKSVSILLVSALGVLAVLSGIVSVSAFAQSAPAPVARTFEFRYPFYLDVNVCWDLERAIQFARPSRAVVDMPRVDAQCFAGMNVRIEYTTRSVMGGSIAFESYFFPNGRVSCFQAANIIQNSTSYDGFIRARCFGNTLQFEIFPRL